MIMQDEEIIAELKIMEQNPGMITKSAYRANTEKWPTNQASFTEVHTTYLKLHPAIDAQHYLANLRLMIRVRS